MSYQTLIFGAVLSVLSLIVGYFVREFIANKQATSTEQKAKKIILDAQDKAVALLNEVKKEERENKAQLNKLEERLLKKEEGLEKQRRDFDQEGERLKREFAVIDEKRKEADETQQRSLRELERVTKLSAEEAKRALLQEMERANRDEITRKLHELEHQKRDEVEKKSVEIITTSLQRYARTHVSDLTTTVFHLADEELKGKIIGREGRNIRALERATGVEIIMDEAPDSIVLSSFDPVRREVAKVALEKLIKDGRIQPAKIEEKVQEAKDDINKRMQEIGDQTVMEFGIVDFPKEITQLLGRLYFRTSYGQNVLVHSIEMAHIAGMIAAELGANVEIAKKGALVHDIGKAISHEVEGTHVELGRKILQKYGISEVIIKAMEAHHEEYPFSTPESFIVAAADVISAARPGARRDNIENYLKRLDDLEKLAAQFPGVKNAYALSAGREIRVFVVPEKIDDFGALQLAKDIASKVQSDLKYPGEIKVNVIRETRAVEYAK